MPAGSRFGERFRFARIEQAHRGREENDSAFARGVGVVPGAVTGYKEGDSPPPVARILAIAKRCGVDPGWLAFGEDSAAPAPNGFAGWLEHQPAAPPIPLGEKLPRRHKKAAAKKPRRASGGGP